MKSKYTLNKKAMEAAKKLYDYLGWFNCIDNYRETDFIEAIEIDLEYGFLTDHDGKDGKYYLWYMDGEIGESVAIRVDDGEILTDEKQICDIVGIHYDNEEQSDEEGC